MDNKNAYSFLSSSTTDRVHNTSPTNSQVIDLTQSLEFPTINWPSGTIDLNESVTGSPRIRRRRNGQNNRNRAESFDDSNIVIISDSPAALLTRPLEAVVGPRRATPKTRRAPKTKKNENIEQPQETKTDYRDRSPMFFGDCPICFEPLGKNPLASTKCGHVFCAKCLQQALKISRRCPNCRTVLRGSTGYHRLYFPHTN